MGHRPGGMRRGRGRGPSTRWDEEREGAIDQVGEGEGAIDQVGEGGGPHQPKLELPYGLYMQPIG